jgi:hypothetical protein
VKHRVYRGRTVTDMKPSILQAMEWVNTLMPLFSQYSIRGRGSHGLPNRKLYD